MNTKSHNYASHHKDIQGEWK